MQENAKKNLICKIAGEILRELREPQSQFMFGSENDISVSIVNTVERGIKDPQLTTVFKIAEALDMPASKFIKMIEDRLPEDFYLIEK